MVQSSMVFCPQPHHMIIDPPGLESWLILSRPVCDILVTIHVKCIVKLPFSANFIALLGDLYVVQMTHLECSLHQNYFEISRLERMLGPSQWEWLHSYDDAGLRDSDDSMMSRLDKSSCTANGRLLWRDK